MQALSLANRINSGSNKKTSAILMHRVGLSILSGHTSGKIRVFFPSPDGGVPRGRSASFAEADDLATTVCFIEQTSPLSLGATILLYELSQRFCYIPL